MNTLTPERPPLKVDSFMLKKADGFPKQAQAEALLKLYAVGEHFTEREFWETLGGGENAIRNMLHRASQKKIVRWLTGRSWERI